ncbi:MAG: ABC transporter permease, partial [Bacteroidetes bacterium]
MKSLKSKQLGIWFALIAEILLLTILTSSIDGESGFESTFLNWTNLSQVIRALSFIAIMAVGQSVVIITGGIDLGVGSMMGLTGVVTAWLLTQGVGIVPAMVLALFAGLAGGFANGMLITQMKLPPFIVTLGMMSIARGLAFAITGGETIRSLPKEFLEIGQGELLNIPLPILVMVLF